MNTKAVAFTVLIGSAVLLVYALYVYRAEPDYSILWLVISVLTGAQTVALLIVATNQLSRTGVMGRWLRITSMGWCIASGLFVTLSTIERFGNHGFLGMSREPFLGSTAAIGLTVGDIVFTALVVLLQTMSFCMMRASHVQLLPNRRLHPTAHPPL